MKRFTVTVVGLGEVGSVFSEALASVDHHVYGFDPFTDVTPTGVERVHALADCVGGSDAVLVATSASTAVRIAADVAPFAHDRLTYIDLNAAHPDIKRQVQALLPEKTHLVDGAILGSIRKFGARARILLSGAETSEAVALLDTLGGEVEVVGEQVGDASTMKLVRSAFMKTLGASIVEAIDAGRELDVESWVRGEIARELTDGAAGAERLYDGTRTHAVRRSVEATAAADLLTSRGIDATMASATARKTAISGLEVNSGGALSELGSLPVANVGDALDRHTGILPPQISRRSGEGIVVGRALTIECTAGSNDALHRALQIARSGDFLVVSARTTPDRAMLGELIGFRSQAAGVVGLIVDGAIRDVDDLQQAGISTWSTAVTPAGPYKTSGGHVGRPIAIGSVVIQTGDIVVADDDGIMVLAPTDVPDAAAGARRVADEEQRRRASITGAIAHSSED
ncbi:DUF1932 domain-containing protein [Microbacterium sp. G2-8]|uniref:RraA family protein n=1 Tax=Microbacterium sp. G2-8 TaxID=2842454 RepID=UPI001C89CE44|nr:DUF1932 domain-containing protein [Microbacterium sp. G2-8]